MNRIATLLGASLCLLLTVGLNGCASVGSSEPLTDQEQAEKDRLFLRENNMIVAENEPVEDYLYDIASDLYGEQTLDDLNLRIHLVSNPAPQAAVLPDGLLIWHVGLFEHLSSEDEVAALLAHEISHLTLDHHETNQLSQSMDAIMATGELATVFSGAGSMAELYMGTAGMRWASNNVIFPPHSAEEETEADIEAARVLANTGYNADAVRIMLSALRQYYGDHRELETEQVLRTGDDANEGHDLTISVDAIASNLGGYVKDQWGQAYDTFTEREAAVRSTLTDEFPDRERSAFNAKSLQILLESETVAPWISEHRLAFGVQENVLSNEPDVDRFSQDFDRLLATSHVSDVYAYDILMQTALRFEKPDQARKTSAFLIDHGEGLLEHYITFGALSRQFGDPDLALRGYKLADDAFSADANETVLPLILAAKDDADISHGTTALRCLGGPSLFMACLRRE